VWPTYESVEAALALARAPLALASGHGDESILVTSGEHGRLTFYTLAGVRLHTVAVSCRGVEGDDAAVGSVDQLTQIVFCDKVRARVDG
jgi:hypothetical protein